MALNHCLFQQTSWTNFANVLENLLALFQINIDAFIDGKVALYKHFRLSSQDIESWPYYEYEMTIAKLKKMLEAQKEQEEKSTKDQQKGMPNMNKMGKQMGNIKMPSMPKMK